MRSIKRKWQTFRCPGCRRVDSFPLYPVGPGRPQCTYGHHPITMERVQVYKLRRNR